ncbi:VOC family protein [Salidesulfovibrio onnuriiensis]|uniref:VOC family protein n=1 Tax=Salidesulfovibrio onnuriiensis TaxID=2583823 RepID=UPI0011C8607A|nr:VOC family protein [Salidesulfovibrio onnuriiensis]
MTITFEGPAIFVADINRSRQFYETVMGQKVEADHGPHVAFKGFSLWQADAAVSVIYGPNEKRQGPLAARNFELYFESDDIRAEWQRVMNCCDTVLNELEAAPWLQLGFRVLDPDGHIVEVAEPLPQLIKRLHAEGMSPEDIYKNTSIPLEFVNHVLKA